MWYPFYLWPSYVCIYVGDLINLLLNITLRGPKAPMMNIINGLTYVMFELSTRIFYREFQALQLIFLAVLGAVD